MFSSRLWTWPYSSYGTCSSSTRSCISPSFSARIPCSSRIASTSPSCRASRSTSPSDPRTPSELEIGILIQLLIQLLSYALAPRSRVEIRSEFLLELSFVGVSHSFTLYFSFLIWSSSLLAFLVKRCVVQVPDECRLCINVLPVYQSYKTKTSLYTFYYWLLD